MEPHSPDRNSIKNNACLQNLWLMRVQILQWTLKFSGLGIINNNISVSSLVPKGLHGDEASLSQPTVMIYAGVCVVVHM